MQKHHSQFNPCTDAYIVRLTTTIKLTQRHMTNTMKSLSYQHCIKFGNDIL